MDPNDWKLGVSPRAETILWIDIETTDLQPDRGRILEVAGIITDLKFKIKDYLNMVIHQDESVLDHMSEWSARVHGESGLTEESRVSRINEGEAGVLLAEFVAEWCDGHTPLAGSSVHFDRKWIEHHFPGALDGISHRNLDVSSVRFMFEALGLSPGIPFRGAHKHRAMDDLHHSLQLARTFGDALKVCRKTIRAAGDSA